MSLQVEELAAPDFRCLDPRVKHTCDPRAATKEWKAEIGCYRWRAG